MPFGWNTCSSGSAAASSQPRSKGRAEFFFKGIETGCLVYGPRGSPEYEEALA